MIKLYSCNPGLEIATDTVANMTRIFHFVTRFILPVSGILKLVTSCDQIFFSISSPATRVILGREMADMCVKKCKGKLLNKEAQNK